MRNIILFGPMGAGKTTIAELMVYTFGKGYVMGSLGRKIHEDSRFYGQETRQQMQQYGQAMREIFGDNVWNDYLHNKLHNSVKRCMEYGRVIIDDGRQLNEYDYWTQKGFIAVGVLADENIRRERLLQRTGQLPPPEAFQHDTEIQALKCVNKCGRFLITNNGTICDLEKEIRAVMKQIEMIKVT